MKNLYLNNIILRILNKIHRTRQNLIYNQYRTKYNIHPSFGFSGDDISFNGDGKIYCGKDSYIGRRSLLLSMSPYKIWIGERCRISYNVSMFTMSAIADQNFASDVVKYKIGDIIIKDYVWIGSGVFINPDIIIGTNSIIGANSVVTHNIPANSVAGGVPAKVIKMKYDKLPEEYIHQYKSGIKWMKKFGD